MGSSRRSKKEIDVRCFQQSKRYNLVGARTVVIHADQLPPPEELDEYGFHVSIENLDKKKGIDIVQFSNVLERYAAAGVCMDVSHNYTWSPKETKMMVERFGNRITHVHFSAALRGKTHVSMGDAPEAFFRSIKPLQNLDVPIIIEEDMDCESVEEVESEIIDVKKVLRG